MDMDQMTRRTDGPWAYEQNMDGGGNPIPHSYSIFADTTDDETNYLAEVYSEDDAKLMAYAPELLAAGNELCAAAIGLHPIAPSPDEINRLTRAILEWTSLKSRARGTGGPQ